MQIFYIISCIQLSDFADIAQVIIAVINVILAFYVFIYQKKQNKESDLKTAKLNEQNIKLQWFKELIIQPNIKHLENFFEHLESLKSWITSDDMNEEKIINLNRTVNDAAAKFRIDFYDIMLKINDELYKNIKTEIENLVTILTTAFSNDEHKLTNEKTYNREILEPIRYAKHNIITLIFNYKGI